MSVNESVVFRGKFVSLAGPTFVDLTLHAKDSASFEFSLLVSSFMRPGFNLSFLDNAPVERAILTVASAVISNSFSFSLVSDVFVSV